MRRKYQYLSAIAINGLLCLFLALPASAQRGGSNSNNNSSSSSSRPAPSSSSSGSTVRSAPSSGNSNSYRPPSGNSNSYRPAPSTNNGYRPAPSANRPSYTGGNYRAGAARVGIAPARINSQGIRPPANRIGFTPGGANIAANRGYVAPGNSNVVGTRGYVGQGGRGSVGNGGRGFYSPYWTRNHYNHYNHGYYGTYYTPRLGFRIGVLPYGYYSFYYDDSPYFYSDGLFYSYDNSEYTVVEPPIGAEVTTLPSNAQSIVINGQQYYEADGVYYEPITKDDGSVAYQVAGKDGELNTAGDNQDAQQAPQIGDVVTTLPDQCRKINVNGEKYYVSPDGYYFQETRDQNGNKAYKIVGTPSDELESQQ
ncbi:MAG: DUF6515 family protein [Mucilaginibacter sp.]